jgi:hypothetical protein
MILVSVCQYSIGPSNWVGEPQVGVKGVSETGLLFRFQRQSYRDSFPVSIIFFLPPLELGIGLSRAFVAAQRITARRAAVGRAIGMG